LEDWEDFVESRVYPEPHRKAKEDYRNYDWLCDERDRQMLPWVKKFNPYDLYSKSPVPPDWGELRLYYENLIARFLPDELSF
jgi:hypothetical protein